MTEPTPDEVRDLRRAANEATAAASEDEDNNAAERLRQALDEG